MVIYHTNMRAFARFATIAALCLSVVSCQFFSHEEEEEAAGTNEQRHSDGI